METGSAKNILGDLELLEPPAHVHLMGICGTGMGSLAALFHEKGFRVTGSDESVYPPMSDYLRGLGIEIKEGYRASNLHPFPDLVVVGNVIRRTNPEAVEFERCGIPFVSMPQALTAYFAKDKTRIVVAGTHGKTTLSSMIAWVLSQENLAPGFMIGGLPENLGRNHCVGAGDYFIIEGDEYDTAYFDKRPKFLHYNPHVAVITSCEFDHGDIYANLEQIKEQFRDLVRLVPRDGAVVFHGADSTVKDIVRSAECFTAGYGFDPGNDLWVKDRSETADGIHAVISNRDEEIAAGIVPLMGAHNLLNALGTISVCKRLGVAPQRAMDALGSFRGVRRRQQIVGEESGILVIDDFAHHPTAVKLTCEAVRSRYPRRRLVAVFEPRTNTSRRAYFQSDYVPAFFGADVIVLREPRRIDDLPEEDRFSSQRLAKDLRALGKAAWAFRDTDDILAFLLERLQDGDATLIMSNGSFDNICTRLRNGLRGRQQ